MCFVHFDSTLTLCLSRTVWSEWSDRLPGVYWQRNQPQHVLWDPGDQLWRGQGEGCHQGKITKYCCSFCCGWLFDTAWYLMCTCCFCWGQPYRNVYIHLDKSVCQMAYSIILYHYVYVVLFSSVYCHWGSLSFKKQTVHLYSRVIFMNIRKGFGEYQERFWSLCQDAQKE